MVLIYPSRYISPARQKVRMTSEIIRFLYLV